MEQSAAAPGLTVEGGPPPLMGTRRGLTEACLKPYLGRRVFSSLISAEGLFLGVCEQQQGGSSGWTCRSRSRNFGRSVASWLDFLRTSTEGFQVCSPVELTFFHLIIFPSFRTVRFSSWGLFRVSCKLSFRFGVLWFRYTHLEFYLRRAQNTKRVIGQIQQVLPGFRPTFFKPT